MSDDRPRTELERIAAAYDAERTRADVAEAQRDRLAAALRELEQHINGHMGWVSALTARHNDDTYWDGLVTQPLALTRAALADVPEAESGEDTGEVGDDR